MQRPPGKEQVPLVVFPNQRDEHCGRLEFLRVEVQPAAVFQGRLLSMVLETRGYIRG